MIDEHEALELFTRRLFAKGTLSIRDAYQVAARKMAEERDDPDLNGLEAECSLPMARAVAHLLEEKETRRVKAGVAFPEGPILVPAHLSLGQERVLAEWMGPDGEGWECAYDEGEYLVLDTIEWKFGPGWRSLYPEIPCC